MEMLEINRFYLLDIFYCVIGIMLKNFEGIFLNSCSKWMG